MNRNVAQPLIARCHFGIALFKLKKSSKESNNGRIQALKSAAIRSIGINQGTDLAKMDLQLLFGGN